MFLCLKLQEVGLMRIPGDYDFYSFFPNMIDFRTDYRGDSITDSKTDKHHQVILLN